MVFDTSTMLLNRKNDYEWGDYGYAVDANIVGSICEGIEARDGVVTKEALLEVAKDPNSPLHDSFEWDNDVAANKYRLGQSKTMINNLRVVVRITENHKPQRFSAFIKVNNANSNTPAEYLNVVDALKDDEARSFILERMYRDMKSFCSRYEMYEEAAGVVSAIKKAVGGIA